MSRQPVGVVSVRRQADARVIRPLLTRGGLASDSTSNGEAGMFNVIRVAPDRIDVEIDGRFDRETMAALIDAFVEAADGIEGGAMLYRVRDVDLPSFGAVAVEFSRLPALLRAVRRFDRIAVVAEALWIRRLSELEGLLLPGVEVRGFTPECAGDGQAWLRER